MYENVFISPLSCCSQASDNTNNAAMNIFFMSAISQSDGGTLRRETDREVSAFVIFIAMVN